MMPSTVPARDVVDLSALLAGIGAELVAERARNPAAPPVSTDEVARRLLATGRVAMVAE